MQIVTGFSLGIQNCWWFITIYGILSILIMAALPKDGRKRILTFPKYNSKIEKIASGILSFLFGKGLLIFSIFIPFKLWTINFYIGTIIYLIGMILSVYAMYSFSKAELSKPVVTGIFRLSRNPMQVMVMVMWIGISIASGSLILLICAVLYAVISYPSFKAQERFCIEKYGDEYLEYMKKTPRYLFF